MNKINCYSISVFFFFSLVCVISLFILRMFCLLKQVKWNRNRFMYSNIYNMDRIWIYSKIRIGIKGVRKGTMNIYSIRFIYILHITFLSCSVASVVAAVTLSIYIGFNNFYLTVNGLWDTLEYITVRNLKQTYTEKCQSRNRMKKKTHWSDACERRTKKSRK